MRRLVAYLAKSIQIPYECCHLILEELKGRKLRTCIWSPNAMDLANCDVPTLSEPLNHLNEEFSMGILSLFWNRHEIGLDSLCLSNSLKSAQKAPQNINLAKLQHSEPNPSNPHCPKYRRTIELMFSAWRRVHHPEILNGICGGDVCEYDLRSNRIICCYDHPVWRS